MKRKRRSIYWNPEKHPEFDAWVSQQENLSAAIRKLFMESRTRPVLSGEDLVAAAREVAPLVATSLSALPIGGQGERPSYGLRAENPQAGSSHAEEAPSLPTEKPSPTVYNLDRVRANALKTARRFRG